MGSMCCDFSPPHERGGSHRFLRAPDARHGDSASSEKCGPPSGSRPCEAEGWGRRLVLRLRSSAVNEACSAMSCRMACICSFLWPRWRPGAWGKQRVTKRKALGKNHCFEIVNALAICFLQSAAEAGDHRRGACGDRHDPLSMRQVGHHLAARRPVLLLNI